MGRHCCVYLCCNDSRCQPAVGFFKFPSPLKRNGELRKVWIHNVNRAKPKVGDSEDGQLWQPKTHHHVCGKHFKEGEPTPRHPVPELHMGHHYVRRVEERRTITKHNSHGNGREKKTGECQFQGYFLRGEIDAALA